DAVGSQSVAVAGVEVYLQPRHCRAAVARPEYALKLVGVGVADGGDTDIEAVVADHDAGADRTVVLLSSSGGRRRAAAAGLVPDRYPLSVAPRPTLLEPAAVPAKEAHGGDDESAAVASPAGPGAPLDEPRPLQPLSRVVYLVAAAVFALLM